MERKAFLDKIASTEGREYFDAVLDYSRFLRQIDPAESVRQAKSLLKDARESDEPILLLSVLTYISTSYIYCSDQVHANYWLEILKEKGETLEHHKALGDYYNMKARLVFRQNKVSDALALLLKALDHYLKTDSSVDKLSCYNALGIIHLDMNDNDKATEYLEMALDIAEKDNNPAQYSIRLNLSNLHYGQKRYKEVIEANEKCFDYFRENEMKSQEATAIGNIGLCYLDLNRFEDAIDNFKYALNIYKELNNTLKITSSNDSIARAYIQAKKPEKAKKYIFEALETAEENDYRMDLVKVYLTAADYFEAIEDYKKSNEFLRKMQKKFEEVTEENQKIELKEIEEKYNTQIYKLKNEELKQSNQTMSKQINDLNKALRKQQSIFLDLQKKFQKSTLKINEQDNFLSSQARMAVMGGMISSIAHQWKQPLNVIWILTQAINDAWEYDELSDEFLMNQTRQIGDQINYMSETINDFRNFFKETYKEDYNVSDVIMKSEKLVAYMISQSGITLINNLDKNCTLTGNPNELSQVLINILNNARQAIEESNPDERLIEVSLECNQEELSISIFNTGNKVLEENLDKIFQPYFTTKDETGTGIGLSICQHIIKNKYNGLISVSNKERGVEFRIDIKL